MLAYAFLNSQLAAKIESSCLETEHLFPAGVLTIDVRCSCLYFLRVLISLSFMETAGVVLEQEAFNV